MLKVIKIVKMCHEINVFSVNFVYFITQVNGRIFLLGPLLTVFISQTHTHTHKQVFKM